MRGRKLEGPAGRPVRGRRGGNGHLAQNCIIDNLAKIWGSLPAACVCTATVSSNVRDPSLLALHADTVDLHASMLAAPGPAAATYVYVPA
jgi:hypothetical protein